MSNSSCHCYSTPMSSYFRLLHLPRPEVADAQRSDLTLALEALQRQPALLPALLRATVLSELALAFPLTIPGANQGFIMAKYKQLPPIQGGNCKARAPIRPSTRPLACARAPGPHTAAGAPRACAAPRPASPPSHSAQVASWWLRRSPPLAPAPRPFKRQ